MAILKSQLQLSVLDGVTGPMRRIGAQLTAFQASQRRLMSPLTGTMGKLAAFGAGYLGVTAGINSTIGAAIKFESAFADVRKVVDANEAQFANLRSTILKMSTQLPITAVDMAALFAAAAESGVATGDLKAFAEMAARVGIAFDMSAGEAGESLAKLKTQLGLTVAETGDMADAINHLSNNMASKASEVTDFMLRVGALAEMGGFAKEQIAAIGSAMIAAGAQPETAATAMQNVVKAMTRGAFAKKSQRDAAKALGLDLPSIAKDMQKDAPKAVKTVLKAIAKAPKSQHIALLSQFFGDEAKAFAPLIGNIGLLDQALDSVASKTNYAGSAFREYVARASTTGNVLQLLANKFADVFRGIGDNMLPWIKEAALGVGDVLESLGSRATIFDQMGSAMRGFLDGFGVDGGVRQVINDLGDLLFGKADGSAAADKLGQIFVKFQRWGGYIREFSSAVADNPIVKFLASLSGYGFDLFIWAAGFGLLAGAIVKLGRAVAMLTGLTTAIAIIKSLGRITGLLGDATIVPPRPPGGPKVPPLAPAGSSFMNLLRDVGKKLLVSGGFLATVAAVITATVFENLPPADPSLLDNPNRAAQRDIYQRTTQGVPFEGGRHRLAYESMYLPAGQQTINPLPQAKNEFPSIIKTEPTGVQNVNVTNPIRPNVSLSVVVHAVTNAPAGEIGAAVGAAAKTAIEGTFTDGGM